MGYDYYDLEYLLSQKEVLQHALIVDAINLIGMHKLITPSLFDDNWRDLWYSLFTDVPVPILADKKETCVRRLQISENMNLLNGVTDTHLKYIIEYVNYRIAHLKHIDTCLQLYTQENIKILFNIECDNPYSWGGMNYPYLDYESEQCYETI